MPKQNPYFPKLPETATISYYNPETDQNLTFEEWNKLNSTANPSEIRIINKGEVYRSWKAGIDYPTYGPVDFIDDASALIVARSQAIMDEIKREYPTVVQLLNYNRAGTIAFLKANGGLTTYELVHDFDVSHSGSDGKKVWQQYKNEIRYYVDKMCRKLTDKNNKPIYQEELALARIALADHIYQEYYNRLPRWPAAYCQNTERININIGGSYKYGANYVVWNCSGWITVTDINDGLFFSDYKARFTGSPEIKVLLLDFDKLGEFERDFRQKSIEEMKAFIDRKQIEYRISGKELEWDWDKKYI